MSTWLRLAHISPNLMREVLFSALFLSRWEKKKSRSDGHMKGLARSPSETIIWTKTPHVLSCIFILTNGLDVKGRVGWGVRAQGGRHWQGQLGWRGGELQARVTAEGTLELCLEGRIRGWCFTKVTKAFIFSGDTPKAMLRTGACGLWSRQIWFELSLQLFLAVWPWAGRLTSLASISECSKWRWSSA